MQSKLILVSYVFMKFFMLFVDVDVRFAVLLHVLLHLKGGSSKGGESVLLLSLLSKIFMEGSPSAVAASQGALHLNTKYIKSI